MPVRRPQVALIIETSRAYGCGLLQGIARYSRTHGPWALYHQERGMADPAPIWLADWSGDGIIARVESRTLERAILDTGLPTVDLRGKYDLDLPLIETNDKQVCKMAAEHLIERGFRHFAYCGFAGANYSQRRLTYFPPLVKQAGFNCHIYPPADAGEPATQQETELHGILYEQQIIAWIESLPKPIGIMACNDIRGQQVLNACRVLSVPVPEEVAVIGVDNDPTLCELSDPSMSSVEPDTHRIGYEAAALLFRMMQGHKPAQKKTFIDPKRIVTRQSTDVIAIEDPQVAKAARYIREHACEGINVEHVLAQVRVSRTTLDQRFFKALGRSPKAEIIRIQLNRIKQLLSETDFTLMAVAQMTGFKHTEYMCNVFEKRAGMTPGECRKRNRR